MKYKQTLEYHLSYGRRHENRLNLKSVRGIKANINIKQHSQIHPFAYYGMGQSGNSTSEICK